MQSKSYFILFVLFIFLNSFFCIKQQNEGQDLESLRNAVEEFRESINSGNGEKAAEMWTDDAIFMPNGWETIKGKEKVAAVWKQNVEGGFRTKNQETIELVVSGNIGYEVVTQLWTVHQEGKTDEWGSSKYVHIWKKQADGSWKLHLDIWNTNPAPKK